MKNHLKISETCPIKSDVTTIKPVTFGQSGRRQHVEGWDYVRITRTIVIDFVFTIKREPCDRCGETLPMPDEAGAKFITENCDGDRIHFSQDEDCDHDRDRYPAPGVARINGSYLCSGCVKAWDKFMQEKGK